MTKKLSLTFLAVLLAISLAACKCTAEKNAASNIEKTHELVFPSYLEYVQKDAALNAAQKEDRKRLVESLRRMTAELRKSLED